MKLNLPQTLNAILTGTTLGAVSSVMLSLTLEPQISESRMGQYGAFIGLIASATSVAMVQGSSRNNTKENRILHPNKQPSKSDLNPILRDIIRNAAENHLNALQPGSDGYFQTLELYGNLLSGENSPPPTNLKNQ